MSRNTKDKILDHNNAGKTTPAATAPMANPYANATILEKIENLIATFRHTKSNETSSRFLSLNIKGNDKFYQTPYYLAHYRAKEVSAPFTKRPHQRTIKTQVGPSEPSNSPVRLVGPNAPSNSPNGRVGSNESSNSPVWRVELLDKPPKGFSFAFSFEFRSKHFSFYLNQSFR
ncbi:hypothetical protein DY000_02041660 [Brassica cretica]|uniref:SURP motif domain-containing protein n=1 Tax=Brassica cretica TaxID=69181 RepID=A0ABQ7BNF1_BRACR|nr:hypothetical protein DY000_02041660 [Brassica cretica]